MTRLALSLSILALSLAGSAPASALSNFLGAQIQAVGLSPDLATVAEDLGVQVVGAGVEFPASASTGFSQHDIDLSAFQIVFSYTGSGGTFDTEAFNGFRLTDSGGNLTDILSVAVNSAVGYTGANAPVVSFDADNVWVNFSGLTVDPGNTVTYDVTFAVPEPGTLALVALGLVGASLQHRRRRP